MNAISENDRPTLTRTQVAQQLGVSYRHVINLVAARLLRETRLPSPKGGRSLVRYSQADVEAYERKAYRK